MVRFPTAWQSIDTILGHDWLTGMRGGERCLELLAQGFPDADIYTLICDPAELSDPILRHSVHTSALQHLPLLGKRFRNLLPIFPELVQQMRPRPADLLITTTHCVIKGLPVTPGTKHLCYCFTPIRYGLFYDDYFGRNPLKRCLVRPMLQRVLKWDHDVAQDVDHFVGISQHVRRRIQAFYGRDADVVYPPVDLERCRPGGVRQGDFDLVVSALVPYKRIDLAVETYSQLGFPLKVVGTGSEFRRLKKKAGPNVEFLGWQTDRQIVDLYRTCRLLVFPGEEDFGIVPLEAQACGTPVIAYAQGGALETLVPDETAIFFEEQTAAALETAVRRAARTDWFETRIRENAERFSAQHFLDGLDQSIQTCLDGK